MSINSENIFTNGALIQIRTSIYIGRKKMSFDQMEGLPTEIVRGVHDLFEKGFKEKLEAVRSYDLDTRRHIDRPAYSVPFPINGVYFVPNNKIDEVYAYLDSRKQGREELIQDVLDNYEAAINSFADKYPDYYARARYKYPTVSQLRSKYNYSYGTFFISPVAANKRSKEEFDQTIKEMRQDVINTIYSELIDRTNTLKRQSSEGKMNQRTFNNLSKFLEEINSVYSQFVDRDDLKNMIAKVKAETLGITAEDLRDNNSQREKFHKAMTKLTNEIQALPDVEMKRSLDF